MKKYIMVVDEGTTGVRAIIFDHNAKILSQSYTELNQIFPHVGWCEQEGNEIWDKTVQVAKTAINDAKIKASSIEAVGVSAQRTTNLLWNKKTGKPVYNAITWQDTRTADLCKEIDNKSKMRLVRSIGRAAKASSKINKRIRRSPLGARLVTAATLSFSPASSLAHTRWILDNVDKARELYHKGDLLFGTIDTWIIWNMTKGKTYATDFSNASTTGIYDSFNLKWSNLFLDLFNITEDILPEVLETNADFGLIDKKLFGDEIPIRSSVADQQSALFADGCFNAGDVKCTNGTGSFIDMNVGKKPSSSIHKLLPLIAWKIDGEVNYMLEGMITTTGSAIKWLKENLLIIKDLDESESLANSVQDSSGVYFVPAFTGLSSPYWDPHATGMVIGLSRKTKKEHIVRAALEGIVYRCKDVMVSMEIDSNLKIPSIKVDGGASKNNFLLQFMADILNVEVERPKVLDSTALGAAFLAGLGCDFWESKKELMQCRKIDRIFKPSIKEEERVKLYNGWNKAIVRSLTWGKTIT